VARPSNSRSLRSAQSRTASGIYDKRVPSFVVSRQQCMKYPGYYSTRFSPLFKDNHLTCFFIHRKE